MYKQAIMEALLSTDNNLTKDQLDWAIKNIPNESGEAQSSVSYRQYNHDLDSMMEACGFTNEECKRVGKEYFGLKGSCKGDRKSELIQHVFTNSSLDLQAYLMMRGIISLEEAQESDGDDNIKQLMELLKKLGKK